MIYTDGEPTICSVGTCIKVIEKPRDYKLLIRDLIRIQHADYLHSFNLQNTDRMKSYYNGKINACLDILDRIDIM